MARRGIIHSLIWCLLSFPMCFTDKLSPDQKAPLFARGSGGLILRPPFEGEPKVAVSPSVSTNVINEDGVERQESATFKLVDGELVRVVEGSFSYKSPEGIPVSVHYIADENGYRAGFRLGAAAIGETGHPIRLPEGITPAKNNVNRSYLPSQ
ncbi:larval cuticle protein LCP-22-like [Cataglyphis hispanica]|uniref:larval cuticle protein LCP-22-like n=1 Tax=Cataglyphis hispanica TaxID=1086592 RepID=UPI0021802D69|nr:larval cuticle protein LCP-22-like [Cataglyphis hispanica]